jgi:FkbM family methyltransferase
LARTILGAQSRPYRAAAHLFNGAVVSLREGPAMVGALNRLEKSEPGPARPIRFKGLEHPLLLRPGTHDAVTVISTIVRSEYGQLGRNRQPATLIDAGAYIGDTTAYFLSRFPRLQAIALEPNPDNFTIAERNLAPYGDRVTVLPMALSSSEGVAHFSGGGTGGGISEQGFEVATTTLPRLLDRLPQRRVGILKLDIEGAETALFRSGPETWLPNVDCIIAELHGQEANDVVLGVLKSQGWTARRHRSVWYCAPMPAAEAALAS